MKSLREFFIMELRNFSVKNEVDLDVREVHHNPFALHRYVKLFIQNFNKSKFKYFVYFLNNFLALDSSIYIVYNKNKPIAIFTVKLEDEDIPYIYDFSIKEEYRGKGLGSLMISWIQYEFSDWDNLYLLVECENEKAYNLYKHNGFEIVGFLSKYC